MAVKTKTALKAGAKPADAKTAPKAKTEAKTGAKTEAKTGAKAGAKAEAAAAKAAARKLTEGQRAYEAKRAAKAGVTLDKWLDLKQREADAEARAKAKAAEPPKPKKTGFLSRLLERAQKPLKP
jgi:hypothetical protein